MKSWLFYLILCAMLLGATPTFAVVQIDLGTTYQIIDGFGASIASLEEMSEQEANYFFTTAGMGFTIARTGMNEDGEFQKAGLAHGIYNVPNKDLENAIKVAKRGAKIMAFVQFAPAAWLDANGSLLPDYYDEWAVRYSDFLSEASANNITITAFAPSNEPDVNGMGIEFSTAQMYTFVHQYMKPAIDGSTQPNTKIMLTECGLSSNLDDYVLPFSTNGHLSDIGYLSHHDYFQSVNFPSVGKRLWLTEASSVGGGFDPSMSDALYWAGRIHLAMIGGASAYLYLWLWEPDWYVAFGGYAGNGGLQGKYGDGRPDAKRLYAFGNYSRFVRPGYKRVSVVGAPANTSISAYSNGNNEISIVAIATEQTDITFAGLGDNNIASIWRTSESEDMAQLPHASIISGQFSYTLSEGSITTFKIGLLMPPIIKDGNGNVVTGYKKTDGNVDNAILRQQEGGIWSE